MSLKIAILASGSGTNAQAIIDRIREGFLDAEIELVISNRPGAGVLSRAEKAHLPTALVDHKQYADRKVYDQELARLLLDSGCEIVVLAGYMRLLTSAFLDTFKGHVLNIHPALLPSFPGTHGAQDALDYGVKLTGATVHIVEEHMDSGPIIIQGAVPVNDDDSLEDLKAAIHVLEHRIYPQALQWLAEKRLEIDGRHVRLHKAERKLAKVDGDWLVWPPLEEGF